MGGIGRIRFDPAEEMAVDAPGQRVRRRDSMFLSARLRFGADPTAREARVRNLSAGGLMAEYDVAVDEYAAVTLEMRGLGEITGRIAWCTRGRIGIAFDMPIDPSRARTPVGNGGRTPDYVKPLIVPSRRR